MSDYPTSTDPTSGRYHEPETIDADAILDGDTDDGAAPEPIRIRSTDGAQSQTLPFFMVRRENMYDPDYQKLLFPVVQ